MRLNDKTRAFLAFSKDLLGYKKMTTALNIFCNVIIFSHQAAVTFCIREILNGLEKTPGQALQGAVPFLAGILIVSFIRVGAIMVCAVLDAKRSYYYQNRLRMNIFKQLFERKNITTVSGQSGPIFETLDDDVPASTFPAELLTEVSGYFIYTIIALTMLLTINCQLTLFIFIPLSAAIFGVQRLSERMKERRKQNRAAHDAASTFLSDVADAALAIKTAGASEAVLNQYDNVNAHRRAAVMRDAVFNERVSILLNGAVCIGSAVMMFIAARLMAGESFGIGDFSLFIAHLGTLSDCTNRIVELIYESKKAEVSYERIIDVIGSKNTASLSENTDIELRHISNVTVLEKPSEHFLSFAVKNLCYTYSGEDGFKNVTFSVSPGKLVVVAGGMASGKSTLLGVLMGLMPQDDGDILWNGETMNDISSRVSNRIAGAPQRSGFFAADIQTNLCLGKKTDDSYVEQVLKIASLSEFLSESENRLSKNIGDRGDKLSGGQRQRLALARTIFRGAAVNIIDDCVSALDERTCGEVLNQLKKYLSESRCSIIIATNSRPFLESADNIIFMKLGRVAATGSFQELLTSCSEFCSVVSQV